MDIGKLEEIQPGRHTLKEVLRLTESWRGFLETPVPDDMISSHLEDAQLAPSNCNPQPWEKHIVKTKQRGFARTLAFTNNP